MMRIRALITVLISVIALTGRLGAANLQLIGNYSFQSSGASGTVVMNADTVRNADPSGRSGSIRLELWAFTTPYSGGSLNGHRMAIYSLSPLNGGSSWSKVSSGSVTFTSPPAGTYFVSLMVTEYTGGSTNDGYLGRDYGNFVSPLVIESSGTGGGRGNLKLLGTQTYIPQNNNTTVVLQATEVRNAAPSGRSGALRLELWATASAYSGNGRITGYKLAQYSLSSLNAGSALYAVSSGSVSFDPPPAGTWNVVMVLTEYTGTSAENNGFSIADYRNFPVPMTTTNIAPVGGAGSLTLSGRSTYTPQNGNTTVLLEVENVRNNATVGTSGSLRLELWAFASPYSGGSVSGQKLAQYQLAPLAAGASRTNFSTGSIPFTKPSAGTWYISLLLTENDGSTSNNGGYGIEDYSNFPVPMVITNNTGNAVPVSGPTFGAGGSTVFYIPDANGSLWAAGRNNLGQLGDGTNTDRASPVLVAGFVSSVAVGSTVDTTVFVKRDGSAWGMGRNTTGGIGDGTTTNRSSPVLITSGVASAAVGGETTLFVKTNGTLWACGWNQNGGVGDGTTTMRLTPVQVSTGVVAAAAGVSHSLFLKSDGTLWGMGLNTNGQLGDGTTTNRPSPVLIATGVASMAAGYGHSMFLKSDGTLWGMGSNSAGQLGDGSTTDRRVPIQVAAGVAHVTAGLYHTLFIRNDTTLWAMGYNTNGALGDGSTKTRTVPVLVAAGVTSAAAGYYHSVFRLFDGSLWGMGANSGQLGDGSNISRLFPVPIGVYSPESLTINYQPVGTNKLVGQSAILTVTAAGNLPLSYQWFKDGNLISGAISENLTLSNLQVANSGDYTVVVSGPSGTVTSNPATLAVTLSPATITSQPVSLTRSVGQSASFSVTAAGSFPITYQWQFNGVNIVGATSTTYSKSNLQLSDRGNYTCVVTNPGGSVISVAAVLEVIQLGSAQPIVSGDGGDNHTLFVTQDGELWGTGSGGNYQMISQSNSSLKPVRLVSDVAQASAGHAYTMYVKTDGTLWGVGSGYTGTGLYGISGTSYMTPMQVATGVATVSAGYQHILFAKSDGSLWGIGTNAKGQLGNGSVTNASSPVQITTGGIRSLATGLNHSAFVKSNGSLWTMGGTSNSQLGDGTLPNGQFGSPETLRLSPVQIVAAGVASVATGAFHTMWVKTDGTLWAVGNNGYGQLCDNTQTLRSIPVQVATGVSAVYAANNVTMVLKTNGTIWVAGEGVFNPSGTGPYALFQQDSNVSFGWLGEKGARFWVKKDGTIWAVGANFSGELGDGFATHRATPVQIATSAPVVKAEPGSHAVSVGAQVSFSVTAGASPTPSFQWFKNDAPISGATSATYSISSATAADAGNYKVVATNSLGSATSSVAVLTVNKAAQNITFNAPPTKIFGDSAFTITATASSGLPVTFTSSNTAVATVSGTTVIVVGAGAANLYAKQEGNHSFDAAPDEARTLSVAKANQTLTFGELPQRNLGDTFSLNAVASSGLPVTFGVVSGPANLTGNMLSLTATGTVSVRAFQPGDSNYNAAPSIERAFTVISGFSAWRNSKFTASELLNANISGPTAILAEDRLPNLLKYALGLEPKQNTTTGLPIVAAVPGSWTFTYSRPAERTDINYSVEYSTDLANWSTSGVTLVRIATGATETWQASKPQINGQSVFFRLRAELQ